MRAFGASFATEIAKKATPDLFLTVGLLFVGNPVWLCERRRSGTVNGHAVEPLIMAWGAIASALERAPEIVDLGNTSLTVSNLPVLSIAPNAGRRLGDLFGSDLLAVKVEIWMHAVKPDTTIVSEILLKGVVSSPTREEEDVIQLDIEPASEDPLLRSILKVATKELYPTIRTADVGKPFAWPMGTALRIPALRLDTAKNVYTICERPAENLVTSVNDIRWERVKIGQDDIAFDLGGESESFNFSIAGPSDVNGNGYYIQNNDAQGSPNTVELNADPSGPFNKRAYHQEFVVPSNLINPTIPKIILVTRRYNTPRSIVARVGEVVNSDVPPESNLALARSLIPAADVTDPAFDFTTINFPLLRVSPGKAYFLSTEIEGPKDSDPSNNYVIGSGLPDPGYKPMLDNLGTRLTDSMRFFIHYSTQANLGDIQSQTPESGLSSVMAPGYMQPFTTGPGRPPIVAYAMSLKTRVASGLEGSIGVTLEGRDSRFSAPATLATIEITAADIPGGSSAGTYVRIRKVFDAPVLLGPGNYTASVDGLPDPVTGAFGGWDIAAYSKAVSDLAAMGARASAKGVGMGARWPSVMFLPNTPSVASITIAVTIHALRFTTAVNGIDHAGFSEVEFEGSDGEFVTIDDSVNISADVTATKRQPDEVIHALLNRPGIVDADIDLAGTFAASAAEYASRNYRFDSAITQQQTYKSFLIKACFECRSAFDWQWDKAQLKFLPKLIEAAGSVRTFARAEIANKVTDGRPVALLGMQISRSERSEIVSLIKAKWDRQLDTGDYDNAQRFDSAPAIALHGELSRDDLFAFDYVTDPAGFPMIADVCGFWLEYFGFVKRIYAWTTDRRALGVEKEDLTDFDLTLTSGGGFGEGGFGEGGFGGGTATFGLAPGKLVRVQRVQYDWGQRRIELKAREL